MGGILSQGKLSAISRQPSANRQQPSAVRQPIPAVGYSFLDFLSDGELKLAPKR
jgi:hypothetical protein